MITISIITVTFRSAATIADTCISIARQTYPHVQHIIVDGGSTDGTIEIAQKSARVGSIIVSEPDDGIYDAMNKGLRLATGDVIGFLNADDIFSGSGVLSQVAEVFRDSRYEACFSDLVYVDQNNVSKIRRVWRTRACKPVALSIGWIPPHPTFYVRRQIYLSAGGFDLAFRLAADHEIMCRFLFRKKIRIKYVPVVWVCMRLGGATNRNYMNVFKQNIEIIRSLLRHNTGISPLWLFYKFLDRVRQKRAAKLIDACRL